MSVPQTSGFGVPPTSIGGISLAVRRIPLCLLFLLRCCTFFLLCDFLIHRISLFYQRIGAMWLSLYCFGQRSYSSLTLLRDALNIIIINISNLFGIVTAQCGLQSGEIACLNIHSISPWPILRNHYNKLSNWIISLIQKVWVQYQ